MAGKSVKDWIKELREFCFFKLGEKFVEKQKLSFFL